MSGANFEGLWLENDGLNNGTRHKDVKGPKCVIQLRALFFDPSWLVRVPLLNPVIWGQFFSATTEY